eukprot:6247052-Prymnesium_polylepis.2
MSLYRIPTYYRIYVAVSYDVSRSARMIVSESAWNLTTGRWQSGRTYTHTGGGVPSAKWESVHQLTSYYPGEVGTQGRSVPRGGLAASLGGAPSD